MRRVRALMAMMVLGASFTALPTAIQAQQKQSVVRVSATVVNSVLSIPAMDSLISRAARDSVAQPQAAHSVVWVVVEDASVPALIERVASPSLPAGRVRRVTIEYIN